MCSSSVISSEVAALELMTGNGTGFGRGEQRSLPGLGAHSGVKNESRQCVCLLYYG